MNTYLSDLFFAMDRTSAEVLDSNGNFESYDSNKIYDLANQFYTNISGFLQGIGILHGVPSPEEIVDDFFNRL